MGFYTKTDSISARPKVRKLKSSACLRLDVDGAENDGSVSNMTTGCTRKFGPVLLFIVLMVIRIL